MILSCGEALIDMLPITTEDGQSAFVPHTGGAVFNTAIALGRLGVRAGLLTGLSSDFLGQMLEADLHASGVETSLAIRSDRPTTLAFVQLIDGHASYTFYDENSAGRMLDKDELPDIPTDSTALFCGGISLMVEPAADFYAELAIRESSNKVIAVDPNIRPGFIASADRYRSRLARLFSHTDIVKVSDEDLDWIFPGSGSQGEKITELRSMGPKIAVLTRGSAGATAWLDEDRSIELVAPKVEVVDTVGAGDTFNAGLLASLSNAGLLTREALPKINEQAMAAALDFAARTAAVTVSRAGANPPWLHELAEAASDG